MGGGFHGGLVGNRLMVPWSVDEWDYGEQSNRGRGLEFMLLLCRARLSAPRSSPGWTSLVLAKGTRVSDSRDDSM